MAKIIVLKWFLFFCLLHMCFLANAQLQGSDEPFYNKSDSKAEENSIVWYDAGHNSFNLVGFEWFEDDSVFRRLPLNPKWTIRESVNNLADNTAGGQVRFITDSRKILINVELKNHSDMYHMPATGQSGFDLYLLDNNKTRYLKTACFHPDSVNYQTVLFENDKKESRKFILNFPLYNGVKKLKLGFGKNAEIKPLQFGNPNKIVIYGTSITQGGCVSRPGMAYSNIISRELDIQFVNLGFSGNGKGEPALAKLINQIPDMALIILDYEANASKTIVETLDPFIQILREKNPVTPILIMSKIRYANEMDGSDAYKHLLSNRDFQHNLVQKRKKAGDKNIYFLDGSKILGDDYFECTVDGIHPNDLGAKLIADGLTKKIRKILQINQKSIL